MYSTETNINTIESSILSGSFTIPEGAKGARITYINPFSTQPFIQLTPIGDMTGSFYLSESSLDHFTLNLSATQSSNLTFNWLSRVSTESSTTEILDSSH